MCDPFQLAVTGYDDHRKTPEPRICRDLVEQLESVRSRHFDVGEEQVERPGTDDLERLKAVLRGHDIMALTAQVITEQVADAVVVLGANDAAGLSGRPPMLLDLLSGSRGA